MAHDSGGDRGDHRYPAGLLPQPLEGGASWWLARLEWVVILSLVTAIELGTAVVGPAIFRRATARGSTCSAVAGLSRSCWSAPRWRRTGWRFFAAEGFAPYGHYPRLAAAIFVVGVLLVALCPRDRNPRVGHTPRGRS